MHMYVALHADTDLYASENIVRYSSEQTDTGLTERHDVATRIPHLPFNTRANTTSNNYKLLNDTFYYHLRKHFFSA